MNDHRKYFNYLQEIECSMYYEITGNSDNDPKLIETYNQVKETLKIFYKNLIEGVTE